MAHDLLELLAVVGDAAARAAERERRTNDRREAGALDDRFGFVVALGDSARGDGEPDARHRLAELPAVFGDRDRLRRRADQLDAVPLERARLGERHRDVERRLSAHRRQDRVGPLLLENQLDELGRHRLDVRPIRELRIGHDRRRIRVDEDYLVPLFLERLRRLRPGIVELGGLPDDDRA